MAETTIQQLAGHGQSVWLDNINRSLFSTGKLENLIKSGLRGMTSNPSIFHQAISGSDDYDDEIVQFKKEGKSVFEVYDELTITDIRRAADAFAAVYKTSNGLDGYVSLEINPLLSDKVDAQIEEGIRLFEKVGLPNVMIKVPATKEGFPVVAELLGRGINVNVTLIFSLQQYVKTVEACFSGLNRLAEKTDDLSGVRSVASVFISRIDSAVDKLIDGKMSGEIGGEVKAGLLALKGKAAVANSRIIFEKSKELFAGDDFRLLKKKNANIQRLLWASTSTKNPQYSDIKYITELISSPTVNTIPDKTLMAFLEHGKVKDAFEDGPATAEDVKACLKKFDINVDEICLDLLDQGIASFNNAFESLLVSIEHKAEKLCVKL